MESVNRDMFYSHFHNVETWATPNKTKLERLRTDKWKYFFKQCIPLRSLLPSDVVTAAK